MLYGCAAQTLSDEGLLQLKEVTFAFDANGLREIAVFCSEMAVRIESGDFEVSSHFHIGNITSNWDLRHPETDVIAIKPI